LPPASSLNLPLRRKEALLFRFYLCAFARRQSIGAKPL
jgi:hypothetical protein